MSLSTDPPPRAGSSTGGGRLGAAVSHAGTSINATTEAALMPAVRAATVASCSSCSMASSIRRADCRFDCKGGDETWN